jgi:hypothetical protein
VQENLKLRDALQALPITLKVGKIEPENKKGFQAKT